MFSCIDADDAWNTVEIQAKFWFEIIRLFDVDGNGEIDRWELATILQTLGTSLSEEEIDHLVRLPAFLVLSPQFPPPPKTAAVGGYLMCFSSHALFQFSTMDLNGDGKLSSSELLMGITSIIAHPCTKRADPTPLSGHLQGTRLRS